jgi:hypothetical protein
MYDSDRGMFRFFIVWLEFTEFEGKIFFAYLHCLRTDHAEVTLELPYTVAYSYLQVVNHKNTTLLSVRYSR